MIIKGFVALGFVIKVDDMLSETFPAVFKKVAGEMILINGPDQNTMKKIKKRLKRDANIQEALVHILINTWYGLFNNFYIVIYYYFMPMFVILINFYMFYK